MFLVKLIICCFTIFGYINGQDLKLLKGFYQNITKNDSLEIIKSDNKVIEIKLNDGSEVNFSLDGNIFKEIIY